MLAFYLGQRQSGKSLLAELLALSLADRPAYAATLPDFPEFKDQITAHQRRRGPQWTLTQLIRPSDEVLPTLEKLALHHDCVLLDGLSALLWWHCSLFQLQRDELVTMARGIVSLVTAGRGYPHWIVVDCPAPFALIEGPHWFNDVLRSLHAALMTHQHAVLIEC